MLRTGASGLSRLRLLLLIFHPMAFITPPSFCVSYPTGNTRPCRESGSRRGKEEAPPTNGDTGSPENSSGDTGSPSALPYAEPEACLLQNADAQTVQDAIQHLNRNEQTVIQFYYFRQETTNEIAVRLGCSVQNVRRIKRRALTRLRSLLER